MNILVIGAGYFSQRIHIPTLKKNKKIKQIFVFDERTKLAELAKKKFNIQKLDMISEKKMRENNIKNVILTFNREKSYYYAKKIVSMGLNLLAEKPAAHSLINLKQLILLSKKKRSKFKICYQKTYFKSILYLKKNLVNLEKKYGRLDKNLQKKAVHCSEQENIAVKAERESIKFMQIKYMQNKIGETFNGIISGVSDWGIYVELEDSKCEGMVYVKDIKDDKYYYNSEEASLIGKKNKNKYQLGDRIAVEVKKADLVKKHLDFTII